MMEFEELIKGIANTEGSAKIICTTNDQGTWMHVVTPARTYQILVTIDHVTMPPA